MRPMRKRRPEPRASRREETELLQRQLTSRRQHVGDERARRLPVRRLLEHGDRVLLVAAVGLAFLAMVPATAAAATRRQRSFASFDDGVCASTATRHASKSWSMRALSASVIRPCDIAMVVSIDCCTTGHRPTAVSHHRHPRFATPSALYNLGVGGGGT